RVRRLSAATRDATYRQQTHCYHATHNSDARVNPTETQAVCHSASGCTTAFRTEKRHPTCGDPSAVSQGLEPSARNLQVGASKAAPKAAIEHILRLTGEPAFVRSKCGACGGRSFTPFQGPD